MPRLGSLIVCEKVISDSIGKPTLISVFQKMSAVVPEGQEMPKDTIAGTPWSVFSEWFFTTKEADQSYDQVFEVLMPDGTPSPIRGRITLKDVSKEPLVGSRCFVTIFGFPISQVGFVSMNVWLESNSERVTDVYSAHVKVEHTREAPSDAGDGSPLVAGFSFTQTLPVPKV